MPRTERQESNNAQEAPGFDDIFKTAKFPVEEKIITTDMLDEKIARINSLIHSNDCLLPNTIDSTMNESDDFIKLLGKFLDQKLLMARKCIHMSHFVEDIQALAALALTPALLLINFVSLSLWSGLFQSISPENSQSVFVQVIPRELRPFVISCIPLVIYLLFLYFVSRGQQGIAQTIDVPTDFDDLVASVYPKLKMVSDFFHDNDKRRMFLFLTWSTTGLCGIWFLGTVSRLCGLLMMVFINFLVGLTLTTSPSFAKALHQFYSPVEREIRIISFSPFIYTIITFLGTLLLPLITRRIDYDHIRELNLNVISIVLRKFKGVITIQKGMRNVRELLKVTTHFQDLAQGLVSLEVDREAGRALANEFPKVAGRFYTWASGTIQEHFNILPEVS